MQKKLTSRRPSRNSWQPKSRNWLLLRPLSRSKSMMKPKRQKSVTTFVQLGTDTKTVSHQYRKKAYAQLRSLAAKYQSTSLAEIAVGVKTGGHFDKVMVMIDKMIALLRK